MDWPFDNIPDDAFFTSLNILFEGSIISVPAEKITREGDFYAHLDVELKNLCRRTRSPIMISHELIAHVAACLFAGRCTRCEMTGRSCAFRDPNYCIIASIMES